MPISQIGPKPQPAAGCPISFLDLPPSDFPHKKNAYGSREDWPHCWCRSTIGSGTIGTRGEALSCWSSYNERLQLMRCGSCYAGASPAVMFGWQPRRAECHGVAAAARLGHGAVMQARSGSLSRNRHSRSQPMVRFSRHSRNPIPCPWAPSVAAGVDAASSIHSGFQCMTAVPSSHTTAKLRGG